MRRRRDEPLDRPTPAWRDLFVIAAACAAAIQVALIWLPTVPLGIPGEWTWPRIGYGAGEAAALFLGTLAALPAALAYVVFCRVGDARIIEAGPRGRALWLTGLAVAGFVWLCAAQEAAPDVAHRLGRGPLVLYFPSFSGYFTEARQAEDFPAYLANYEARMAQGDVLHIGTHPPGLTTIERALLELYRRSEPLTDVTLAARPRSVRDSEAMLAALPQPGGKRLTDAETAMLWAAALLVQAAAAAAVVPLYYLAKHSAGRAAAWRAACLWPLVPALCVFLPKSDALFPLLGLGVLALWHAPVPPAAPRAAAAGMLFWFGMTLSLAMLPVALLTGVLTIARIASSGSQARRSLLLATLRAAAVAAATFLLLTGLTWLVFDLDLITTWSWNYRNHAAFYGEYDRTYWKWLLVNPLELAVAVGLPVAAAAAVAFRKTLLDPRSPALPVLCVVGLLWLSGKNSGEAARLWLFLMPWLLWVAASAWDGDAGRLRWRTILPLQLLVAFLTGVRVSGFGFLEIAGLAG